MVANGIIANAMSCSQIRDLKCNRICKLLGSSSYLGTFYDPYSSFLEYQFLHYLVHTRTHARTRTHTHTHTHTHAYRHRGQK